MIDLSRSIYRKSGRQNYLNVWVVCDSCGTGRWCQKHNAEILPAGHLCRSCSNSLSATDRRSHSNGYKQCAKCSRTLPLSCFTKRIDRIDSYRGKCNDCMADDATKRREINPEKVKEQHRQAQRTRRARKTTGNFTLAEWRTILEKYDNKCLCCGTSDDIQPDHIIPLSVGGSNSIDNIQPLCGLCNRRKQAKIIDYRNSDDNH